MSCMAEQGDVVVQPPVTELPAELGLRLRRAREARGMSLRALAGRLQCSPSHVSQIERGLVAPSISLLYSIVSELGMSMETLFAAAPPTGEADGAGQPGPGINGRSGPAPPAPGDPSLPRVPGEARYVVRFDGRKSIEIGPGVRWDLLTPTTDSGIDFREIAYAPGSGDNAAGEGFIRHPGREYGVVLEGRLHVQVEFDEFALGPGDSIAFDSIRPHRFWNDGPGPARAIWVSNVGS